MAGTISFGGIGSGMDTEGIVTGLVNASSGNLSTLKNRASDADSAVSSLSSISGLLATLQKSVDALANTRDVGAYTASSSSTAVAVSANGTALPGSFDVKVTALAKEQRNYSTTFSSMSTGLGQVGTLSLQVGTGTAVNVDVTADDTLDGIAAKINASGQRISASVFNDGTTYRLQVRGLDTGEANSLTFGGSVATSLGLNNTPASKVQSAQDAALTIDGFAVKRPTNQISGAIQGVTLALTETTASPISVRVQSDPAGLQTKVQSVVDSFNAVVNKIHQVSGYGTTKGTVAALQSDSSLRAITERLSSALTTKVGTGAFQTMATVGLTTNRDGTLKLDSTKLSAALSSDAAGVATLFAGAGAGKGVMDIVSDLTKNMTASKGTISLRSDSLSSRAKSLRDAADREQDRLNRYADSLRKQFTAMDTAVAGSQAQMSYINKIYA